jgi:hypothetical protein
MSEPRRRRRQRHRRDAAGPEPRPLRPRWYKLIGKLAVPCSDMMEWARWFETANRRVMLTAVGPLEVSTVFLGLDHNYPGFGPDTDAILFETMIRGDEWLDYQTRCATWGEAEAQHAEAVEHAKAIVANADAEIAILGTKKAR